MTDDPTPELTPEPLSYYRAGATPPPSAGGTVASAVLLIAGLIVGAVAVTACGVACGIALFEPHGANTDGRLVAAAFAGVALACVAAVAWQAVRGRGLPPERGRRSGRFFLLGLFIGGGLAALGQGLCFGANS